MVKDNTPDEWLRCHGNAVFYEPDPSNLTQNLRLPYKTFSFLSKSGQIITVYIIVASVTLKYSINDDDSQKRRAKLSNNYFRKEQGRKPPPPLTITTTTEDLEGNGKDNSTTTDAKSNNKVTITFSSKKL